MTTITLADLKLSLEQRRRLEALRAREKPEGSTPGSALGAAKANDQGSGRAIWRT